MTLKKSFMLVLSMIVICHIATSCTSLENTDRRVTGEYVFSIEPDVILQSIANQEDGVFSPVSDESEVAELYPNSVDWIQSDYYKIADALHAFVWNESLRGWKLDYMSFLVPCNQVGNGFQQASFSFFQNKPNSDNSEIEHQIDIYPRRKTINAWEFVYNSKLIRLNSSEITAEMLTVEDALMIAESSGGHENRIALDNKCEISVTLLRNTVDYHEWNIYYSPGGYTIKLDPFTGELIK